MVLNVLAKTTENLGGALSSERIELSLEMTVLGVLAVFSVLAIIWLVLVMFKFFFYRDPSKNSSNNDVNAEDNKVTEQPPLQTAPAEEEQSSDDATVAAIIAAISAYIADDPELSNQYSGGFRVVSFKRVRHKATWNNKNN